MKEEYKNYIITIEPDENFDSPREWEPSTVMLCDTKRYFLGDVKNCNLETEIYKLWVEYATSEELYSKMMRDINKLNQSKISVLRELIQSNGNNLKPIFEEFYTNYYNILGKSPDDIELPLKLTWNPLYLYDHGQISISNHKTCRWDSGFVGIHYVIDDGARTLEEQYKLLKAELGVYDQYLRGEVYWFSVENEHGDLIDSCGGFYGYDAVIAEARDVIDYHIENTPQQLSLNLK